jgi:hypothetical protein
VAIILITDERIAGKFWLDSLTIAYILALRLTLTIIVNFEMDIKSSSIFEFYVICFIIFNCKLNWNCIVLFNKLWIAFKLVKKYTRNILRIINLRLFYWSHFKLFYHFFGNVFELFLHEFALKCIYVSVYLTNWLCIYKSFTENNEFIIIKL